MRTVFLYTTPTSATSSIIRICNTIIGGRLEHIRFYDKIIRPLSDEDAKNIVPPKTGYFLLHNWPPRFNKSIDLNDYDFVVNFRDPRDRICNEFHWALSHPQPNRTPAQMEAHRKRVADQGIDSWILERLQKPQTIRFYDNLFWLLECAPPERILVNTYSRLCCDFDSFVIRIADFLDISLNEATWEALLPERPEHIENNKKWIGSHWGGSDVMPGRYKHELAYETISELNAYFAPLLKRMAHFDGAYATQYLEGIGD